MYTFWPEFVQMTNKWPDFVYSSIFEYAGVGWKWAMIGLWAINGPWAMNGLWAINGLWIMYDENITAIVLMSTKYIFILSFVLLARNGPTPLSAWNIAGRVCDLVSHFCPDFVYVWLLSRLCPRPCRVYLKVNSPVQRMSTFCPIPGRPGGIILKNVNPKFVHGLSDD